MKYAEAGGEIHDGHQGVSVLTQLCGRIKAARSSRRGEVGVKTPGLGFDWKTHCLDNGRNTGDYTNSV